MVIIYSVQVRLRTEVLCTIISTRAEFKLTVLSGSNQTAPDACVALWQIYGANTHSSNTNAKETGCVECDKNSIIINFSQPSLQSINTVCKLIFYFQQHVRGPL